MNKKINIFSVVNLLGALCAWLILYAMYYNYRTFLIIVFLFLIAIAIIRFYLLIKFKEEINHESPSILFKISNGCFGLSVLIMTLAIAYIFH